MKTLISLTLISTFALGARFGAEVVYEEDNRLDIEDVRDIQVQKISKAVAARVQTSSLAVYGDKFSFDMAPKLSDRWGAGVCENERFASQPVVSDCSGFLVGEDLLATAGHCVVEYPGEFKQEATPACSDYSWVFDFKTENGQASLTDLDTENVYGCAKVVYAKLDRDTDFALIKLERKARGRTPLKMRKSGSVERGEPLFVMGYPSGLPLKYADGARVVKNSKSDYFSTNLDTFGGNSGSPVFNARTYEVEGILVRGRTDYVDSRQDGHYCRRVNTCDKNGNCEFQDSQIDGEHVTRVSRLLPHL